MLCLLLVLQTNNELEAQRVATEFAFRKRLREMEKVYSELKWQEKNVSLLHFVPWGLDFLLWDEEPEARSGSPERGQPVETTLSPADIRGDR